MVLNCGACRKSILLIQTGHVVASVINGQGEGTIVEQSSSIDTWGISLGTLHVKILNPLADRLCFLSCSRYDGKKTDIYCLGICLHRMVLGEFPKHPEVGDSDNLMFIAAPKLSKMSTWKCLATHVGLQPNEY